MLNLKSMKTGNYSCLLCEKEFEPIKEELKSFVVKRVEINTITIKTSQKKSRKDLVISKHVLKIQLKKK